MKVLKLKKWKLRCILSFLVLSFSLFLFGNNVSCDVNKLSVEAFQKMLTTEKNDEKKNYVYDKSLYYQHKNKFQHFLHLETKKDFVLYMFAKWDADSNNLITMFREVARTIHEKNIDLDFYILNIDKIKELCSCLNITVLPVVLYVSSIHKKACDSLVYKMLSSSKDVRINNAFRYNGDIFGYDHMIDWIELHYYFTKTVIYVKSFFLGKTKR